MIERPSCGPPARAFGAGKWRGPSGAALTARGFEALVAAQDFLGRRGKRHAMFVRRHANAAETVTIHLDGAAIAAPRGENLAAVLLSQGELATGTAPVTGAPRGPYCMIGTCFGCLVEIEGRGDVRACLTPVRDGLRVRRRARPRDPLA